MTNSIKHKPTAKFSIILMVARMQQVVLSLDEMRYLSWLIIPGVRACIDLGSEPTTKMANIDVQKKGHDLYMEHRSLS